MTPDLTELHELLMSEVAQLEAQEITVEDSMFNDAFSLFSRMETIDVSIAQLISAWSNPKELLLVFDTRLERLIPRATREVEEYSDSEDQIENDSVAEESVEDEEEEENPFDPIIAFQEFVKLIDLYALVITKVKTAKPLLFMTGGIKLIQSTLLKLAERRIFESSIPFTTSEGNDSTSAALLVLRSVLAFINGLIGEFDWISKNGAWVASIIQSQDFLLNTIWILQSYSPATFNLRLAERHFYSLEPKYEMGRIVTVENAVDEIWSEIFRTAEELGLDLERLYGVPEIRSIPGSLSILAATISRKSPTEAMLSDLLSNPTTMTKMIDLLLPELKNSFDSPSGSMEDTFSVSQDQALYTLSYLVDNRSSSLSETSLVELIQVLAPFCTLSPHAPHRLIGIKLISKLILFTTEDEDLQMSLLQGLLVECPFESVRVASIGILRDLIGKKLLMKEVSLFTSPTLLSTFLFPLFDSPILKQLNQLSLQQFMQDHYKISLEVLGMGYWLLARDSENSTGIRLPGTVDLCRSAFIAPLKSRLIEWRNEINSQLLLLPQLDTLELNDHSYSHPHTHSNNSSGDPSAELDLKGLLWPIEILEGAVERIEVFLMGLNL